MLPTLQKPYVAPARPADDFDGDSSQSSLGEDHYVPPKKKKKKDDDSFDWSDVLKRPDFSAASVSQIKHVRRMCKETCTGNEGQFLIAGFYRHLWLDFGII
jgi:hypothetical protein